MSSSSLFRASYTADGNIVLRFAKGVDVENCFVAQHDIAGVVGVHCNAPLQHFTKRKVCNRKKTFLIDSLRFAGTFSAVFCILFVLLNFQSYSEMSRAFLFPSEVAEERAALQQMTLNGFGGGSLPIPPALPRAGSDAGILSRIPEIAPPDNRIIIPKIGLNVPLVRATDAALQRGDFQTFEKDVQDALLHGAVHYPGTAQPGDIGNVFITGHSSNYPWIRSRYNSVFSLLPQLQIGDEYSVFSDGELYRYRIVEKREVSSKDVSVLDQPADRRMSTLMTCTPVGTTLRRLILLSEEIDPATGEALAVKNTASPSTIVDEWGGQLAM